MLSLVGMFEPVDGVAVPDPRDEPGPSVARTTCGLSPVCPLAVSGSASPVESLLASWGIVVVMVVEERGSGREY
jgi:hypothetical protein